MPSYLLTEAGGRFILEDGSGFLLTELQPAEIELLGGAPGGHKRRREREHADYLNLRQQHIEELRAERERLGIIPREARRIAKAAPKIAAKLSSDATPDQIAERFDVLRLVERMRIEDAERRHMVAAFIAREIERIIVEAAQRRLDIEAAALAAMQDDDEAMAVLLLA